MELKYYRQLTKLLRRKGIDDARIVSTLNDVKGWVKSHPGQHPATHFGPAGELVRDLPKGNEIHTPQKIMAGTIAIAFLLVIVSIIAGMFNVNISLGLPLPMFAIPVLLGGVVAYLMSGSQLPANFRP